MNTKFFKILSWVATFTAMLMYISYIPQISGNIHGHKGDFIQPFVAGINCTLWILYGLLGEKRDSYSQLTRHNFWIYSCIYSSIILLINWLFSSEFF